MNATSELDQILFQVDALLANRRTQQARSVLGSALSGHPGHTGLLLQLAWADYLDERNEDALQSVRSVLSADPHNDSARLLAFELLMNTGDVAEAERTILSLLQEYPEQAHYYGRYAHLLLHTLHIAKARRLGEEGLKHDPENAECLSATTICDFIEQCSGKTSTALQQMLAHHPESARSLALVVVALEQRGDRKSARMLAQELLRAQPDDPHFVELARNLRIQTHWSLIPLRPMQRYGWAAAVAIWAGAVVIFRKAYLKRTRLL